MAVNEIEVAAAPEAVFAVLADPERYADWVVGAAETDELDPSWPAEGATLRYEAGAGPLTVAGVTEVVESEPPRRLVLRALVPSLGEVAIELELEASAAGTRVVMREEPVEGVLEAAHTKLSDAALSRRNEVALDRLRRLVEERPTA